MLSSCLQNGSLAVKMHICCQIYFCICKLPFPYFPIFLLVVENYIWQPNPLAGHIQRLHSPIFNWVPFQLVVVPCLEERHRIRRGQYKEHSAGPLCWNTIQIQKTMLILQKNQWTFIIWFITWSTQTLVVITWSFRFWKWISHEKIQRIRLKEVFSRLWMNW